jgi:hypothetical protein
VIALPIEVTNLDFTLVTPLILLFDNGQNANQVFEHQTPRQHISA